MIEEYNLGPDEEVESEDGLKFRRLGNHFQIEFSGHTYPASPDKGEWIPMYDYDLYLIKDGNDVKVRVVPTGWKEK